MVIGIIPKNRNLSKYSICLIKNLYEIGIVASYKNLYEIISIFYMKIYIKKLRLFLLIFTTKILCYLYNTIQGGGYGVKSEKDNYK